MVRLTDTLDRVGSGLGGCLDGGGPVPPVAPQPPGLSPLHQEVNNPKKQAVVDRYVEESSLIIELRFNRNQ